MKKTVCILLALILLLTVCGGTAEETAPSVTGRWNATAFLCVMYGMSEADFAEKFGDVSMIYDFTPEGLLIVTLTVNGSSTSTQQPYTVDGDKLSIDGTGTGWKIVNGDLILQGSDGIAIALHPVYEDLLTGKWDAMDWICAVYGMDREAVLAADPGATVIMEFNSGIMSLSVTAGGETEINNYPYTVEGNIINIGGIRSAWSVQDDVLTIRDNEIDISLPRVK
ncbi:MAG: hypothetical protein CW338_02185 [Clostridiales bacterium]|nr:hypothetical protein [Clostridiales bacterium]